jgi:brefeldin A-inhibited guanine nucleotide-exchange protein
VLVVSSFEAILNSKDAKRIPALKAAAQKALDILKSPSAGVGVSEDKREDVFEPLKLACETKTNTLMITALDAIGKLVSYGFFNPPLSSISEESIGSSAQEESFTRDPKSEQLSEAVVDAICACFAESPSGAAAAAIQAATNTGPDQVNLQIVKALLTLVLQDGQGRGLSVHQSSLVRSEVLL